MYIFSVHAVLGPSKKSLLVIYKGSTEEGYVSCASSVPRNSSPLDVFNYNKNVSRTLFIKGKVFLLSGYAMSPGSDINCYFRKEDHEHLLHVSSTIFISLSSVSVYSPTNSQPGTY